MARPEPGLRLADRFTHVLQWEGTTVLVGEADHRVFDGEPVSSVVCHVDGRRTAIDIAQSLSETERPEVVHFVLLGLEREGLLAPVPEDVEETSGNEIHLRSDLGRMADQLHCAWARRGSETGVAVSLIRAGHQGPLPVLLAEDYLDPSLSTWSPTNVGRPPVLLIRLGRTQVWVGPWIGAPGPSASGACLSCLQERLSTNLVGRGVLNAVDEAGTGAPRVRPLERSILPDAFLEIARLIDRHTATPRDPGASDLLTVHLNGGEVERHLTSRLPQCPACGDPTLVPPGAHLRLQTRTLRSQCGGGYRIVPSAETLARWLPTVDPLTGVVRSLRAVDGADADTVHVYTASHASVYRPNGLRSVKDDLRDPSGGKGATALDAQVSALCESLERFSAMHRGSEPTRLARCSELGAAALHPNRLQLFSASQYDGRKDWNARSTSHFQFVPEPYEDEPIEWSETRSLVTGEVMWVPSAAVFLGFSGRGKEFCRGDSNGLAGGNCVEEAILQGFMELVERDAVALWWYNRAHRPGVRVESFADPFLIRVLAHYGTLGRRVWAVDLTTDLQIPCFAALSSLEADGPEDIIFGFGAHFDARIALRRAFTELNQMLPTVLRSPKERRRQLLPEFADALHWWDSAKVEQHPYLLPASELAPTRCSSFSLPTTGNLRDDVSLCATYAEGARLDLLVHDLTRPDVGFPVVKVIVPGLRHFWRRLGPGRLYDTPVELGWLPSPVPEAELNPISMFV